MIRDIIELDVDKDECGTRTNYGTTLLSLFLSKQLFSTVLILLHPLDMTYLNEFQFISGKNMKNSGNTYKTLATGTRDKGREFRNSKRGLRVLDPPLFGLTRD